MIKTKLHLLRFAYLSYRKLKPVKKICVMGGGKMSEQSWEKAMEEVKLLTNNK